MTTTGETVTLDNRDVLFRFPNRESRDAFIEWLSRIGEQDYWLWMGVDRDRAEDRPDDEDIRRLAVTFDYSQAFAAGDGKGPKDSAAIIPCELCED